MARPEAKDHYVTLNGGRFHYREWNAGSSRPLVFLHGSLAAAVTYDHLASELARSHHVLVLDQRGHGESDYVSDYSWPRWVDDLAAFWDALELPGADLVGHSRGANNASRFAGRYPDRVRRLVLVDGGFGPITNPEQDEYWTSVYELMPADGFDSLNEYVDLVMKLFPRSSRSIVEAGTTSFRQDEHGRWSWPYVADLGMLAAEPQVPTAAEERALRAATTCPTLVVRAEHSELLTGDMYEQVAATYPDGHAALHRGSGHNIMWENVPGLVTMIEDFLQ